MEHYCEAFSNMTVDDVFCARRHRKAEAGDPCFGCERGIQAARKARGPISAAKKEKNNTNEEVDMTVAGKKTCKDCGQDYAPASNVQKRCKACADIHKNSKLKKPRAAANKEKTLKGKKEPAVLSRDGCASCRELEYIIMVFFAAKLVRQNQLDKAREIARDMLSIKP